MVNKSYMVIVFRSRQHALNFVDVMAENGIKGLLIPTPKELSLGCGFSIKFENGYFDEVTALMSKTEAHSNGIYKISIKNNMMKYVKVA